MKVTMCDICENTVQGHPEWVHMSVPGVFLGMIEDRVELDICSVDCVQVLFSDTEEETPEISAETFLPEKTQTEDADEEDRPLVQIGEPERTFSVPSAFRPITPKESEEITGVRRRM